MSAPPGWYPDPAGALGRYRFWDGSGWSSVTSDRPDAAPPGQQATGADPRTLPPRRPWGWWLAGLAAVVAVVVLIVLAVRVVGGGVDSPDMPGPEPSQQSCPRATSSPSTPAPPSTDGRVRSGSLSYPQLPPPFEPPIADSRTPFGYDVQSQQAPVERSADGRTNWVAWALIARLLAGDGFYGPEPGAEVVARCVVALFYDNHEIDRTDTRREAITVDGHEAYLIESHLRFDIPGIQTKGETMIVVVVDVGKDGEAGLFYGTIPDTSPQFLAPIRNALAGLEVG
ncbi:MAG: DUF2510 domain-containing protein [Microlunatus sp.]|nr:DUF2510 domain-containing protein [Microlunatus sp.]